MKIPTPPGYESFTPEEGELYVSEEETEILRILDTSKEHTARIEHKDGIQEVHTFFVSGTLDAKETIVVTVPWSDSPNRDFAKFRAAALAAETKANVILVGFPGMDEGFEGTISREQADELNDRDNPSFVSVGAACNEAVSQLINEELEGEDAYCKDMEFTLLGYSMGASTVAGMLKTLPENYKLTNVILAESPDMGDRRKKAILGLSFLLDGMISADSYRKFNKDLFTIETADKYKLGGDKAADAKLVGRVIKSRENGGQRDVLLNGPMNAMSRGTSVFEDIGEAYLYGRLEGVNFYTYNGTKSKVSPVHQGEKLTTDLSKATSNVGTGVGEIRPFVGKDHTHSMQESIIHYMHEMGSILEESQKAA